MSDTRPRDLTAEELAQLASPANRETQSVPLRVPPGTQIAIELLDPAGEGTSASAAPTSGPSDVPASAGGRALKGTAPTQNPPKTKQHGRDRS